MNLHARLPAASPFPSPAESTLDSALPAVIRMNEVRPRPLDWLWPGWVPLGKLTLLDGDPGQAKSLLLVDLAARVSSGQAMPDGSPGMESDVIFLAPEDGLGDTLLPRLQAAGANLSRVHVIPNSVPLLSLIPKLESVPKQELGNEVVGGNTRLLLVEPFLPEWDRTILHRLAALAERTHCAVIVTRFLNKYAGGKAIYRGAGGMAAMGAARCAMLVAPEPGQEPPQPRPVAPGHSPE